MQILDVGTVKDMIVSADELYEVLQLTTQRKAYEVLQVRHDDLVQHVVIRYAFNHEEHSMAEVSYSVDNIVGAILTDGPDHAKLICLEHVMNADLKA